MSSILAIGCDLRGSVRVLTFLPPLPKNLSLVHASNTFIKSLADVLITESKKDVGGEKLREQNCIAKARLLSLSL